MPKTKKIGFEWDKHYRHSIKLTDGAGIT